MINPRFLLVIIMFYNLQYYLYGLIYNIFYILYFAVQPIGSDSEAQRHSITTIGSRCRSQVGSDAEAHKAFDNQIPQPYRI